MKYTCCQVVKKTSVKISAVTNTLLIENVSSGFPDFQITDLRFKI